MAITIITPDHQVWSNQKRKQGSHYIDIPNYIPLTNKCTVDLQVKEEGKSEIKTFAITALVMCGPYEELVNSQVRTVKGDVVHWFNNNLNSNIEQIDTFYMLILKGVDDDSVHGYPYIKHDIDNGCWRVGRLERNCTNFLVTSGGQHIFKTIKMLGDVTPLEAITAFAKAYDKEFPTEIIYHWDGKKEHYIRTPPFTDELYKKIEANFDLENMK